MDPALNVLLVSAVGIGLFHTLLGVDHTIPFVVLGRAQGWSLRRTIGITALCGVGHVLSSVVLGGIGVALGLTVVGLEGVEATRGTLAAWILILFGLTYVGWSLARRRRSHRHAHVHESGVVHAHEHVGGGMHQHGEVSPTAMTAGSLFVIFVLGPCEPLIPLLMFPALALGIGAAALVALVFGVTTLATMIALVVLGYRGLDLPAFNRVKVDAHVAAGLAIVVAGVAIVLLGI